MRSYPAVPSRTLPSPPSPLMKRVRYAAANPKSLTLNPRWSVKTDDFFPYSDCPHCMWTGYFTSRPTSKGYMRSRTALLNAARQLQVLAAMPQGAAGAPGLTSLEEAVSVAQHHDGISGTAMQHVANDYNMRLARGSKEADDLVSLAITKLATGAAPAPADAAGGGLLERPSRAPPPRMTDLTQCPLLNISYCPKSEASVAAGRVLAVVAYNPLAWERKEFIRVPVGHAPTGVYVTDDEGSPVEAQLVPTSASEVEALLRGQEHGASSAGAASGYVAVFSVSVPPLGYSTYVVMPGCEAGGPALCATVSRTGSHDGNPLSNGKVTYHPPGTAGGGGRLHHEGSGLGASFAPTVLAYESSSGDEDSRQTSGAYIFRPVGPAGPVGLAPKVTTSTGPVVKEVTTHFSPWASLTARLYTGSPALELEWTVGPIPNQDVGREVVVRFDTSIASGDEFQTDSNGREMLTRRRDHRETWPLEVFEPTAGNYYPITAAASISDAALELAIVTDRAQGAASLAPGSLEVM
mmetsp:Transcript_40924/g.130792  ORF Transcript_40924/g.130792 Transcript_40924/m.130792 type:complete len:522 (+) Transcript_40924:1131-2696(+)